MSRTLVTIWLMLAASTASPAQKVPRPDTSATLTEKLKYLLDQASRQFPDVKGTLVKSDADQREWSATWRIFDANPSEKPVIIQDPTEAFPLYYMAQITQDPSDAMARLWRSGLRLQVARDFPSWESSRDRARSEVTFYECADHESGRAFALRDSVSQGRPMVIVMVGARSPKPCAK